MNSCATKLAKIAWVALCIPLFLFATPPKIIGLSIHERNRLDIDFDRAISKSIFTHFNLNSNGHFRNVYDIEAHLATTLPKDSPLGESIKVRVAQNSNKKVRVVLDSTNEIKSALKLSKKRASIIINQQKRSLRELFDGIEIPPKGDKTPTIPAKEAEVLSHTPSSSASSSKPPQKKGSKEGKRIVIDPGHGGKDCGAIGVQKVCEKTIVLNVAKELATELKKRGYKVFLTRDKDIFINLRARTKFANDKEADLFISIHANAVPKHKGEKLQGVETYFLSTARSERAKNVAALENKDDIETMNYFSKQSFLNAINSQRLVASNKLAIDIQFGILKSTRNKFQGVVDGGVREGPFWVLAGALMPSVLLELGYVTHPLEGTRLTQKSYQKQIILGIADGIDGYFEKNL